MHYPAESQPPAYLSIQPIFARSDPFRVICQFAFAFAFAYLHADQAEEDVGNGQAREGEEALSS